MSYEPDYNPHNIEIKDHYWWWSPAVDHLVSQGVKHIGWANDGIPYPKGKFREISQGDFGNCTTVTYYPDTNELICTDMS